jgi:hypothetical protein
MASDSLFSNLNANAGADSVALSELVSSYSCLPTDYLDFLARSNGGEGFVGREYLILWKAEEIVTFNSDYQVEEFAPGIILFGSSGGGEGYAFDARELKFPVVRVPFIGLDLKYAEPVAPSFSEMIVRLRNAK